MDDCKILLKARPTKAQLADRLLAPVPDGLEFYLDCADIAGSDWLDPLVSIVTSARSEALIYVVEGPLRSLDGSFFDATLFSDANRAVIDRLVDFGERVGARAAVIHAMAARTSAAGFDRATHREAMERAAQMFRYYVDRCDEVGMVATVENVPPVARMREGSYMYSMIGMAPDDIEELVRIAPGLQVTLDVSHAQLYINACRSGAASAPTALAPMLGYLGRWRGAGSLEAYIAQVAPYLCETHISNASGLLGEGLPYAEGDLDLDAVVRLLRPHVQFVVTETIESDPDRAIHMREAQRRIRAVLDEGLAEGRL